MASEKRKYGDNLKVTGGSEKGHSWGGFGNGRLEASKGRLTRKVYRRGMGWVEISDN